MTQEIDIWRSAAVLVKHYGNDAPNHQEGGLQPHLGTRRYT